MKQSFVLNFLFFVVFIVTSNGTNVNFVNRCGYQIQLIKTLNLQSPVQECTLNPGDTCSRGYNNLAGNFKNGWNGLTLAEFSFNQNMNMDFYDLSVIVGYDTSMQIATNAPGGVTVTCTQPQCPDAYLYPGDNTKTHGVSTGYTFTVTFCP